MKLVKNPYRKGGLKWVELCLMWHASYTTRAIHARNEKDFVFARASADHARREWADYLEAVKNG